MEPLKDKPAPLALCDANLGQFAPEIGRPAYDRSALSAGILHIGVGNFHRAHQAVYLDDLFNLGRDHDWAIVGAGLMGFDAKRRSELQQQDWLTTVVEMSPGQRIARVTGSMIDYCEVDADALIARITDPAIRIISLTITEGGYFIDANTGGFDANHPQIQRDAINPEQPVTVFGMLLAGLRRRHARGLPMPTILSCDNLPENGHVTRRALEGLAALISNDLGDWVAQSLTFPNAMVDRITPATTERHRDMLAEDFSILDAAPVVCEPFRQWVLEDKFPLGRPALEHVGVQFVSDVTPYETMKLRILNAGHASIAYPAALLGYENVHDAMADPDIASWLDQLMRREVIPVLADIPGEDYHAYLDTCAARFANPEVGDTIARLCQDGSNRQPKFVLPTIADALQSGKALDGLALEVAFWCRYCADTRDLDDPSAELIAPAARATRADPSAFLGLDKVFGTLAGNEKFAAAFCAHITKLWQEDPRSVLRAYLSQE